MQGGHILDRYPLSTVAAPMLILILSITKVSKKITMLNMMKVKL